MFRLLAAETRSRIVCNRDASDGITEAELARDVARLRAVLAIGAAEPVLVLCRDRYHLLVACLAVWADGAVVVLPPSERPALVHGVVARTRARLALVDDVGSAPVERQLNLRELPTWAGAPEPSFELAPETLLVSLFTSGTTGTEQRVDKCARQLLGEAHALGQSFFHAAERTVASTVPSHHLYGLLFALFVPFLAGARFVRETPRQPHEVGEVVQRSGASDLVTVPAHLRALALAGAPCSVARAFSSGAVLEPDVASRFEALSGGRVFDVLGSTESGGIGYREPARALAYQAFPGVDVAAGEEGVLLLRSPFLPDPLARTELADRVRIVPEGFLYEGRDDGVVKVAGKRVALQELERRALELEGVRDAAALSLPSESLRDHEVWLAVASGRPDVDAARVRSALAAYFEPTLLPRRIAVVAQLPRNALGKLERSRALALFEPSRVEIAFTVPEDWVFFQGHFPGQPILPGAAQLSEIVLPEVRRRWPDLGALRRIVRLKFQRPIGPGTELRLQLSRAGGEERLSFELSSAGDAVASGVLQFSRPSDG